MEEIASCIDVVLKAIGTPGEAGAVESAKARAMALMARFPLPYRM
jgi:glycine hydroxymethyltransferase